MHYFLVWEPGALNGVSIVCLMPDTSLQEDNNQRCNGLFIHSEQHQEGHIWFIKLKIGKISAVRSSLELNSLSVNWWWSEYQYLINRKCKTIARENSILYNKAGNLAKFCIHTCNIFYDHYVTLTWFGNMTQNSHVWPIRHKTKYKTFCSTKLVTQNFATGISFSHKCAYCLRFCQGRTTTKSDSKHATVLCTFRERIAEVEKSLSRGISQLLIHIPIMACTIFSLFTFHF